VAEQHFAYLVAVNVHFTAQSDNKACWEWMLWAQRSGVNVNTCIPCSAVGRAELIRPAQHHPFLPRSCPAHFAGRALQLLQPYFACSQSPGARRQFAGAIPSHTDDHKERQTSTSQHHLGLGTNSHSRGAKICATSTSTGDLYQ
jgi:hypothetical protein